MRIVEVKNIKRKIKKIMGSRRRLPLGSKIFFRVKSFNILEAVEMLKKTSTANFIESAEINIHLNVGEESGNQSFRTSLTLPHIVDKDKKIAVIIPADSIYESLLNQGADLVGSDDLIEKISLGNIDFDLLLTTPEMMPRLTKLGKILGPRGLMPSTKAGTISNNLLLALSNLKAGKIECRADKSGVINLLFGKVNFPNADLIDNFMAIYNTIKQNRPSGVKGKYIKSITISATMGPGIKVNISTLP